MQVAVQALARRVVNRFTQPDRGEDPKAFSERREDMIAFVQHRHAWPRERVIGFLEGLSHIGIAYVGVDMKEEQRARSAAERDYNPFADVFPF